tara:strand:- start:1061 stop:2110 length:1050 start_codon:yes stop_codon:yes gene_type:complete
MNNKVIKNNILEIVDGVSAEIPKIKNQTILITGGAGFLGKNIVWTLQELNKNHNTNCKIIVVDNYVTGLKDELEDDDNTILLKGDITKEIKLDGEIDYIIHAAGIASPIFYTKYKLETIDVSIQGTKRVLELARKKQSKGVLFFSTSEVYGSPSAENVPTPETFNGNVSCVGPRAHYDEPKRMAETLCVTYASIYDMKVNIVRPFNVYGPGMRLDDGRGVINIIKYALQNKDLPIYGDGLSTRTWTYITDATIGFIKTLFAEMSGEAFNIGMDNPEISTIELSKLIVNLSDSDSKLTIVDAPIEAYEKGFDVLRRCPDISKSKNMLGFKPVIKVDEGLKRTIDWMREVI